MGLVGCSSMRYGAEDQWDRMPTATDGFFQSEEGSLELIFDHIPLFEKPLAEKIAKDKRTYKDLMVYSIGDKTYEIPVQVEIRGQTSRNDCPFPKLRVSFKKLSVKETPFSGHSGLRINTHCSDKGGYTEIGRVASERGPVRESMAYDLQESAGLPTFQHRLMKVSYKSKKSA